MQYSPNEIISDRCTSTSKGNYHRQSKRWQKSCVLKSECWSCFSLVSPDTGVNPSSRFLNNLKWHPHHLIWCLPSDRICCIPQSMKKFPNCNGQADLCPITMYLWHHCNTPRFDFSRKSYSPFNPQMESI